MWRNTEKDSNMKKTKFNGDYCGEIVLIGFTGNAQKIQDYLKKTFGINQEGKHSLWCKKEKFNIDLGSGVVGKAIMAHIETYPWESREDLEIDDVRKKVDCPRCHGSGKIPIKIKRIK